MTGVLVSLVESLDMIFVSEAGVLIFAAPCGVFRKRFEVGEGPVWVGPLLTGVAASCFKAGVPRADEDFFIAEASTLGCAEFPSALGLALPSASKLSANRICSRANWKGSSMTGSLGS